MFRLSVTIFLSAFLLFQVQPLIAKYILPWFGGGPAVWTTCMLFFQVVLLGGYAYAHLISTRLSRRAGGSVHIAALLVSLAFLPIAPDAEIWKRADVGEPTGFILWLLLANVGVPYFLLSSTTPLVQRWFSQAYPEHSPYRLYALSNTGAFFRLKSGVRKGRKKEGKGGNAVVLSQGYSGAAILTCMPAGMLEG